MMSYIPGWEWKPEGGREEFAIFLYSGTWKIKIIMFFFVWVKVFYYPKDKAFIYDLKRNISWNFLIIIILLICWSCQSRLSCGAPQ